MYIGSIYKSGLPANFDESYAEYNNYGQGFEDNKSNNVTSATTTLSSSITLDILTTIISLGGKLAL